ncbi:MAG: DUF72 domain-containing protein [Candidatus Zixiibacteriota bacterium]
MTSKVLLHIGTSSFSEPDWVGTFYPEGAKPAQFLELYAEKYRTVEIDATYYRIPAFKTVKGWHDRTPGNFVFSAKFPRSIVHGGTGAKPDRDVILLPEKTYEERNWFLQTMSHLKEKLGPLVIQFPYFSKDVFAKSDEFMERLDVFLAALPKEFKYAVEIRNKYWVTKGFRDMLANHGVALTLVDQAWMPHGDELEPKMDIVTSDFCYIRLLGDRKKVESLTDRFDHEVIDQSERLNRWVELIGRMIDRDIETYIYTNNHFSGYSPATADKLIEVFASREK